MSTPEINVHTQEFLEDPNTALGCPFSRAKSLVGTSGPEFFSYATVRDLFREPRVRPKSVQVYLDMGLTAESPIYEFLTTGNFNMMTDEAHRRIRPIILKGFRPARIRNIEPTIRNIARELVDEMVAQGNEANLVHQFSHWLSIRTISAFIGVPREDVKAFKDATIELILLGVVPFQPVIPRLEAALIQISSYVRSLIERRKVEPSDDFISDLIEIQRSGEDLSENELIWCIVFILLAGHDTTRAQIASTARALITSGNWERAATDPEIIGGVVQEALRLYPAAYRFPRLVREDLEVEDQSFHEGDLLSLNIAAAGRDPEAFENPDVVDLERAGEKFDIGFGHGQHHCIGWSLATAEITQSMLELTSRLTDVEIIGDVEYRTGGVIAGPEVMNIRYSERQGA